MMFHVEINNVQHVDKLCFDLDLSRCGLTCVVGRNGVGKTTLARAIRNLAFSDTFIKTASNGIFAEHSKIMYQLGDEMIEFSYDVAIDSLNCNQAVPCNLATVCATELPLPHGDRFNFFQTVSTVDKEIRRRIVLEEYTRPDELIEFLTEIYSSKKFDSLVEIVVKEKNYYCILCEDNRYIREDYLSSGEYFLISLYRTIRRATPLIFVDEIDISLDAAAQVHLIDKLREFCRLYNCNVVFTTHSLAMMRTLDAGELLYMNHEGSEVKLVPVSYGFMKSILFGFRGWDRYILTEDDMLSRFIDTIIQKYCRHIFFKYKIIYGFGGSQVTNFMQRNSGEGFLSSAENVIAILDGDQRNQKYTDNPSVWLIPVDDVEKSIAGYYELPDFPAKLAPGVGYNGPKDLMHSLIRDRVMSEHEIFVYICEKNEGAVRALASKIEQFLSYPP